MPTSEMSSVAPVETSPTIEESELDRAINEELSVVSPKVAQKFTSLRPHHKMAKAILTTAALLTACTSLPTSSPENQYEPPSYVEPISTLAPPTEDYESSHENPSEEEILHSPPISGTTQSGDSNQPVLLGSSNTAEQIMTLAPDQVLTHATEVAMSGDIPVPPEYFEIANSLTALLGNETSYQPTNSSCGPSSVVNAIRMYNRSGGSWYDGYYNPALMAILDQQGTTLPALEALTGSTLGESFKDAVYSVTELEQMVRGLGIQSATLADLTPEQVTTAFETMAAFNSPEQLGAIGIGLADYHLEGGEPNHFFAYIPYRVGENYVLAVIDPYQPSIQRTADWAEHMGVNNNFILGANGQIIGTQLLLESGDLDNLLEDMRMAYTIAIPVLSRDDLLQGTPANQRAIMGLQQQLSAD